MTDRFCPYCGQGNAGDYAFCKRCGKALPTLEEVAAPAQRVAPTQPVPPTDPTAVAASMNAQMADMLGQMGVATGMATGMGARAKPKKSRTLLLGLAAVAAGILVLVFSAQIALQISQIIGTPEANPNDPNNLASYYYGSFAQFGMGGVGFGLLAFGGNVLRRVFLRAAGAGGFG